MENLIKIMSKNLKTFLLLEKTYIILISALEQNKYYPSPLNNILKTAKARQFNTLL